MMIEIAGWIIAAVLVGITIAIHYEIIRITSDSIVPWALRKFHDRRVMMLLTAMLMLGHIIEIWIFAFAMMLMSAFPEFGSLTGSHEPTSFNSYLYYSATSYTSTGYGDISPTGLLRAISVSEALAGLLMISWSASFTYLKMEQIWNLRRKSRNQK